MNAYQKYICKLFGIVIPEPISYYQSKVIEFALKKAEFDRVVLVGDSITEMWNQTGILPSGVVNYGISGDSTSGVLGRINQILNVKPSKILLNVGINDISAKNPNWQINYEEIVKALLNSIYASNIVLCAVRPINYGFTNVKGFGYTNNMGVKFMNGGIKTIADKYGCLFEPETYTCHTQPWTPDEVLRLDHTVDGMHLSQLGYQVEFEVIKKYL
jgi:lysophospholipase L1-like esterase